MHCSSRPRRRLLRNSTALCRRRGRRPTHHYPTSSSRAHHSYAIAAPIQPLVRTHAPLNRTHVCHDAVQSRVCQTVSFHVTTVLSGRSSERCRPQTFLLRYDGAPCARQSLPPSRLCSHPALARNNHDSPLMTSCMHRLLLRCTLTVQQVRFPTTTGLLFSTMASSSVNTSLFPCPRSAAVRVLIAEQESLRAGVDNARNESADGRPTFFHNVTERRLEGRTSECCECVFSAN
jgi:hypothetical protein